MQNEFAPIRALAYLAAFRREHASYIPMEKAKKPEENPDVLKGWQGIAAFLGQPVSVAERWAADGMPVKRQGRYVQSSREELNRWLGRESSGEPVQIATEDTDLSAELKRGLSLVRKHGRRTRAE